VCGVALAIVGTLTMRFARQYHFGYMYVAALTTAIGGVNIAYSSYSALLPDFIDSGQMGRASGVMAVMTVLGGFIGFVSFALGLQVAQAYNLYVFVAAAVAFTTCVAAREQVQKEAPPPASCVELIKIYSIDARANPDFFWVFVTRTFYYMGISIQAFTLFMMRDVQRVADPKYYTSLLAMIGQLSAAVTLRSSQQPCPTSPSTSRMWSARSLLRSRLRYSLLPLKSRPRPSFFATRAFPPCLLCPAVDGLAFASSGVLHSVHPAPRWCRHWHRHPRRGCVLLWLGRRGAIGQTLG